MGIVFVLPTLPKIKSPNEWVNITSCNNLIIRILVCSVYTKLIIYVSQRMLRLFLIFSLYFYLYIFDVL